VSGLETAIRNALDRSDRTDGDTRARIYQSARQALEAGLQRQGVTDKLIVMQQQKRLEEKIREIETEELDRLNGASAEPDDIGHPVIDPVVAPTTPSRTAPPVAAPIVADERAAAAGPTIDLGGATRAPSPANSPVQPVDRQSAGDLGSLGAARAEPRSHASDMPQMDGLTSVEPDRVQRGQPPVAKAERGRKRRGSRDVATDRAPKPRKSRRHRLIAWLLKWVISLAVVGVACWYFYNSGLVQSVMDEALQAANRAAQSQAGPNARFDPRGGFSEEWAQVFEPKQIDTLQVGREAKAEAATGSEGPAVRLLSATPQTGGDIAVTVPADVLQSLAGGAATIAVTVQAGGNQGVQMAIRCDFGSLGGCARHRFTATQERLEALFKVSFDRAIAPNAPGRILINTGLDGADRPVLLYSVRILPAG
jgi:hypothetical protein